MKVLEYMQTHGHEQLVYCHDPDAGLKAIIAIHSTALGPALGGARMWPYATEEEAALDVLRLAQAMSYKNSAAGLDCGGGKAVIIGDPARDKTEKLFRSLGRFVQSLSGRYISTEDVGTTVPDIEQIRLETKYVTGLPRSKGGSGDPSPVTAIGVLRGIKACAYEVYGSDSLKGKKVAIQGVGKVGSCLAGHLHEEGASLVITDVNEGAAKKIASQVEAALVRPDEIFDQKCDIFSPCALGAVLNDSTIPRLTCSIVAGAANNQLAEDRHGKQLAERGILYAPDFIVNAGGVINLSLEMNHYDAEVALAKIHKIYDTMQKVIALAKQKGIDTSEAAIRLAEERIEAAKRARTGDSR